MEVELMTREEIIDSLELYTVGKLKKDRVFITVEELQNLIDEIKALGQEPTTKNEIDCIVDVLGSYTDLDIPYKHEIAENILTKLSSATPTRKKGKWEYDACKDKSGGHCNRCGHFLRYGEKTNFCPDCGADMRGEEV